jgi:hypothetical protein
MDRRKTMASATFDSNTDLHPAVKATGTGQARAVWAQTDGNLTVLADNQGGGTAVFAGTDGENAAIFAGNGGAGPALRSHTLGDRILAFSERGRCLYAASRADDALVAQAQGAGRGTYSTSNTGTAVEADSAHEKSSATQFTAE